MSFVSDWSGWFPRTGKHPFLAAQFSLPRRHDHESLGHVTAPVVSPTLGQPIALAMLQGSFSPGDGELRAVSPVAGLDVAVEITSLPFYDSEGDRMRA